MSKIFRRDPDEIVVPERVIAARLGFKGVGRIPDEFVESFKRAQEILKEVAHPLAIHEDFKVENHPGSVVVAGKKLSGRSVEDHIKGSKAVSVILATLGHEVDDRISKLHEEGEELLSFFLDGLASEMVEYFVRMLDTELRRERGQGGPRISPGYGDLPLSLNDWIVEILNGEEFGITCDPDTHIMLPRKTISAIIGWR